jgi:hypothetical protein
VTKLSPQGSAFIYSTYLGGSVGQVGYGIAADDSGNGYVTGVTYAPDFPTTLGAFQETAGGGGDVFISKIESDGSAFVFSTYLGGTSDETARSIVADHDGHIHVAGWTYSANFPLRARRLRHQT